MAKIVIGVDPDSDRHGTAIYRDGELIKLATQETYFTALNAKKYKDLGDDVLVSIEDVCANDFVYTRNTKKNKAVHAKVALCIGRCQQAQKELMRLLDYFKIEYVLHEPSAANWVKNKSRFQAVTGWSKRSNEDTRSAAYFGFLEAMG